MILACLSCKSRYLVPASHFAAGPRVVRCARCEHTWTAEAPTDPAAAMAEQLAAMAPGSGETAPVNTVPHLPVIREERKGLLSREWMLASLLVVLAGAMLFILADRRDIARRWPQMEDVFDAIGFHIYHPGEGLILRGVRSELRFEGGINQLEVVGEVHNNTDKPQTVPDILAAAIGPDGKSMQSWQIDAPAATVAPFENVPFNTSIHAPKGTVVEIKLNFVESNNGS